MPIRIITTEDGSHSLFDEELNETYHSTRGAVGESKHVFIESALAHWSSENEAKEVRVLEIGFGTGLNAFLTAQYASENEVAVDFYSLEPFPIERSIYEKLNYSSDEKSSLLMAMHEAAWEECITLSPFFNLTKSTCTIESFEAPERFDIVYFDAFAPSKQPDLWTIEPLQKCFDSLKSKGVLVTYCAQGQFKRNLKEIGFEVEVLAGALGKKEMVRAKKP